MRRYAARVPAVPAPTMMTFGRPFAMNKCKGFYRGDGWVAQSEGVNFEEERITVGDEGSGRPVEKLLILTDHPFTHKQPSIRERSMSAL